MYNVVLIPVPKGLDKTATAQGWGWRPSEKPKNQKQLELRRQLMKSLLWGEPIKKNP